LSSSTLRSNKISPVGGNIPLPPGPHHLPARPPPSPPLLLVSLPPRPDQLPRPFPVLLPCSSPVRATGWARLPRRPLSEYGFSYKDLGPRRAPADGRGTRLLLASPCLPCCVLARTSGSRVSVCARSLKWMDGMGSCCLCALLAPVAQLGLLIFACDTGFHQSIYALSSLCCDTGRRGSCSRKKLL